MLFLWSLKSYWQKGINKKCRHQQLDCWKLEQETPGKWVWLQSSILSWHDIIYNYTVFIHNIYIYYIICILLASYQILFICICTFDFNLPSLSIQFACLVPPLQMVEWNRPPNQDSADIISMLDGEITMSGCWNHNSCWWCHHKSP